MSSLNRVSIERTRAIPGLLLAIALIAAACTATTTIESGDSTPFPTVAIAQESAEPNPAPPTPQADSTDDGTDETDADEPVVRDTSAEDEAALDESSPADADPAAEPSPSDSVAVGTTQVVLIDAGAEPRSELRLMIAASCGEITTIEQTQDLTQTVDGVSLPSAGAVGTVVEMATSAARVGDNYDTQAEIVAAYASAGVAPEVAASMNRELERLVGIATYVTITDRGVQVPDTYRVEGAEALGPLQSAVEAVSQVQAPLPVEAVGIGARWETTSVVDFEGAALMTVTEYVITDRDGTVVEMQVSATQTVASGSRMNMQGFDVEVADWTGTTTGEAIVDLATISPLRSVTSTQATQTLDFGAEGLLMQEIQSDLVLTTEPDDGCTGRTTRP